MSRAAWAFLGIQEGASYEEEVVGRRTPAEAILLRSVAGLPSVEGTPFHSAQERHSAQKDIQGSPYRLVGHLLQLLRRYLRDC